MCEIFFFFGRDLISQVQTANKNNSPQESPTGTATTLTPAILSTSVTCHPLLDLGIVSVFSMVIGKQ